MKVDEYKCNVCNEILINVDELIGFSMKNDAEFYPKPVEKASYHICNCCLDSLALFKSRWDKKETMTPAVRRSWEMNF